MTIEEKAEFKKQFGAEATIEMEKLAQAVEKRLNDAFAEFKKGIITADQFEAIKTEVKEGKLTELNTKIAELEGITKEQGTIINELKENQGKGGNAKTKTLEEFLNEKMAEILKMRDKADGIPLQMVITGKMLKDAGVTSIAGSIQDMNPLPGGSPYAPGLGGSELQLFDIVRNPQFILNHVNLGKTNQFRLAWINETDYEGVPDTNIAELGLKPLTQHKFQVEFSTAKKAAAYIEIAEEFDTDVPGLATAVRRMLKDDVLRQFDDQIQANVIAVATPYQITELNDQIVKANLWSALRAMIGQIGHYNFVPNTVAINPLTSVMLDETKDDEGRYLIPPYFQRIQAMLVEANKVAFGKAFVGDLMQFNVDMYKDFQLTVGWINDDFIRNKFAVLGELRYHSYISNNRKKAICYDDLHRVQEVIEVGGSL